MHKQKKSKEHRTSHLCLGLGIITAPAVVSGVLLSSSFVAANDSVVDNINVSVPLSCSVGATGMNSHTDTIPNGTYREDIGTTTMTIVCNDNAGFSVYATGFTNNSIGHTESNKLVGATGATINTDYPSYGSASTWSMKVSSDDYSSYPITVLGGYDYYSPVPNGFTKVATRLSATDAGESPQGATLESTYHVSISPSQAADTYTGQVKYTLVHPNNAPAPIALFLQDTEAIELAVPNNGDTAVAMDARDGKDYMVGRLADGKVWLLDNLALDLTAAGASERITADNTNASATSLNALFNGVADGGQDGNLARVPVRSYSGSNFGLSYTEPIINSSYSDETLADATDGTIDHGGDWTVGTYYNYCAASAGNHCYDEYDGESDATEDICPSGWHMPTGGDSGEYDTLYDSYDEYDLDDSDHYLAFSNALHLPIVGDFRNDYKVSEMGRQAYYWASTNYYSYHMDAFYVYSENGSYSAYNSSAERDYGNPVRCIRSND